MDEISEKFSLKNMTEIVHNRWDENRKVLADGTVQFMFRGGSYEQFPIETPIAKRIQEMFQRITTLEAANAALRAEVERLRGALELCREWIDSPLPADINEQIAKETYLRHTVNTALTAPREG